MLWVPPDKRHGRSTDSHGKKIVIGTLRTGVSALSSRSG